MGQTERRGAWTNQKDRTTNFGDSFLDRRQKTVCINGMQYSFNIAVTWANQALELRYKLVDDTFESTEGQRRDQKKATRGGGAGRKTPVFRPGTEISNQGSRRP